MLGSKYWYFMAYIFCLIALLTDWSKMMYGLYFLGIAEIIERLEKNNG